MNCQKYALYHQKVDLGRKICETHKISNLNAPLFYFEKGIVGRQRIAIFSLPKSRQFSRKIHENPFYLQTLGNDSVKRMVANVFNGGILDFQDFDGQGLEEVTVDLLHVAAPDGQRMDQGFDLAEADREAGDVGVVALNVHAILGPPEALAGVQLSFWAVIFGRRIYPLTSNNLEAAEAENYQQAPKPLHDNNKHVLVFHSLFFNLELFFFS